MPGALPPVIGWAAVRGRLDAGAVALFLTVLLWQVPHFLAIAWVYRDQYARAGLRVLPVADPRGTRTARQMVLYALALVPVSLLPALLGMAGPAAAAARPKAGRVAIVPFTPEEIRLILPAAAGKGGAPAPR